MAKEGNDRIREEAPIGGFAKRFKLAYQQFKKEAKELGIQPEEAVYQALQMWRMAQSLKGVELESFIAGYNFAFFQLRQAVTILNLLGQTWIGSYTQSQLQLLNELRKQQDEFRQQLAEEIKKQIEAEQKKGVEIPEQLRTTLVTLVTNALMNVLARSFGTTLPTQQTKVSLKGVKIE
jgi:hypothetical protein